jgi:hypothetical protein
MTLFHRLLPFSLMKCPRQSVTYVLGLSVPMSVAGCSDLRLNGSVIRNRPDISLLPEAGPLRQI